MGYTQTNFSGLLQLLIMYTQTKGKRHLKCEALPACNNKKIITFVLLSGLISLSSFLQVQYHQP